MTRKFVAAGVGLFAVVAVAADAPPPIPREGRGSGTMVVSATFKALPQGKDRVRMTYESIGVYLGDPTDIAHNASVRCLGTMNVVNGSYDDNSGSCVFTRLDGDQAFCSYTASGKMGMEAKGAFRWIGGTGKLAGLEGGGEFTRYGVKPAAEGTGQYVLRLNGTYRLAQASAAR
jgi:hypothetical protein